MPTVKIEIREDMNIWSCCWKASFLIGEQRGQLASEIDFGLPYGSLIIGLNNN